MCTVFAESEVISLIGRGESRENIAFAVIDSIVQKFVSQATRLTNGQEECICLTGGLCDYSYLKKSLGESLKTDVLTDTDGRYAGAIECNSSLLLFNSLGTDENKKNRP